MSVASSQLRLREFPPPSQTGAGSRAWADPHLPCVFEGSRFRMSEHPPIHLTFPEVFILESMDLPSERRGVFEGRILADMLELCGKIPEYFYFRTRRELEFFAEEFSRSQYRFLHLSCHGDGVGLHTTFEKIQYSEFAQIFHGRLRNRRLFVSACETGNELFVETVRGANRGMHSIVSPRSKIATGSAVAMWCAMYMRSFYRGPDVMRVSDIRNALDLLGRMFGTEFLLSVYRAEVDGWEDACIGGSEAR